MPEQRRFNIGPAQQGFENVRIEGKRLVQPTKGFVVALQKHESPAAVIKRIERARIDFQRLTDQLFSFAIVTGLKVKKSEQIKRVEIFRLSPQDVLIAPSRFREIARLVKAQTGLQVRIVHDRWPARFRGSTARCVGLSPASWRSHIEVKAASK